MSKWRQLPSTVAIGMISRGTGTRLMIEVFSISELVPVLQARVKKLKGTRPHNTNKGNSGCESFGMMRVNTNVRAPIITIGFSKDQKTPRDMFRYRTLKSFL